MRADPSWFRLRQHQDKGRDRSLVAIPFAIDPPRGQERVSFHFLSSESRHNAQQGYSRRAISVDLGEALDRVSRRTDLNAARFITYCVNEPNVHDAAR